MYTRKLCMSDEGRERLAGAEKRWGWGLPSLDRAAGKGTSEM